MMVVVDAWGTRRAIAMNTIRSISELTPRIDGISIAFIASAGPRHEATSTGHFVKGRLPRGAREAAWRGGRP